MPDDPQIWLTRSRAHSGAGDHLLAYDVALRGVAEHPDDLALKHAAVLALARSGAAQRARERYSELGLDRVARGEAEPSLYTDIAALGARIAKDLALAAGAARRGALLREAAGRYRRIFEETGDYYPGVNAASLFLLAGHEARAKAVAASVRNLCARWVAESEARGYYLWASLAEASLVEGDEAAAAAALAEARRAGDATRDAMAATRRQLRLVCAAGGIGAGLLGALPPPGIIFYTGHMIGRRLDEAQAAALRPRIDAILAEREVGAGFGSLASGADIVIAEALLARGADLELVFPFRLDEFREVSVRPAGGDWLDRFERCLSLARTAAFATEDAYLADDHLFNYANRLAIGLALQRARALDGEARLLAIWDGGGAGGPRAAAGTAVGIGMWNRLGLAADVLTPGGGVGDPALAPAVPAAEAEAPAGRVLRAMLFGDLKGFSALGERQLPIFAEHVLGALAAVLDRYGPAVEFSNTWGDGLYVVLREAEAAADCALDLQRAVAQLPLARLGLPPTLGLRLGGHFGPVFPLRDPVLKRGAFMGSHVSRTARIEPVTPEGTVYVTDAFAAVLAATREPRFSCDYVGVVPAAKNYGNMRMFALSRRDGAGG